ncbi:CPBP family intramembrane glutamic endopeptidase [Acetanaerobacterium elongatum]|uniref:CAAX protease self-immunity n=1 Tax=Acetanaerobacterium elongatum TaxID=258515 RepID=A0A1G9UJU3_9FIRM|nr:CPBP family intramembrane glutamic endopeptidase [Acetanaerobacterium elongatum]SDM59815.1 CAAX protease self-immunity [Acetanaerobacterium elongatum]
MILSHNNKKSNLKQIAVYLLLVFVLPLFFVLLKMYTPLGRSDALTLILFGLEAAAPSLAAILTVLYFEASHGLGQFLKERYVYHFNFNMVLLSLFLPVVIIGAAKLFSWLFFHIPPTLGVLTFKKILIVCWALIAEELGWRGFFQDKLGIYLNELVMPIILGIIWAVWHYHYFISGTMSAPLILFTLGCIADSYIYFAVTKAANGNIVPASVLHFSENLCCNLFSINPEYNNGSIIPYLLYVTGSLIAAAITIFITIKRKEKNKALL